MVHIFGLEKLAVVCISQRVTAFSIEKKISPTCLFEKLNHRYQKEMINEI